FRSSSVFGARLVYLSFGAVTGQLCLPCLGLQGLRLSVTWRLSTFKRGQSWKLFWLLCPLPVLPSGCECALAAGLLESFMGSRAPRDRTDSDNMMKEQDCD